MNLTDATDGAGVPPHSIQALVQGAGVTDGVDAITLAENQLIWDTLRTNVAAGIVTYIAITIIKDPLTYPVDGDAQIKAAIATYGNALLSGKDVVAAALGAQAFKVTGVLDVPRSGSLGGTLIKISATPTADTTIAISLRQKAVYDTSRIGVTTSDATP